MNVVWNFNQANELPKGNRGVCMQLVAYWLQLMQYDKPENDTADAKLANLCIAEAQKLQRAYSKAGKDQSVGADEAVTWNVRKLRLRGNGVYTPCATTSQVVGFLDQKRQAYSMGIYFSGGGGHALGFWRSGASTGLLSKFSGHTYFFDPNAGCFKGDTSGVDSWLAAFLSREYPDMNKMEMAKVDKASEARKNWGGAFKYT